MKATCPSCLTNYSIDDRRIPSGGAKLKCAKCQAIFPIKTQSSSPIAPAVPLPGGAPASPALASNGMAAFEPGLSQPVPLPGTSPAPAGARPTHGFSPKLPNGNGAGLANFERSLKTAIPLPGEKSAGGSPGAIPLPGAAWDDEKTREVSQFIPSLSSRPGPIQLPGFDPINDGLDDGFADADLVEPPSDSGETPSPSAVPLPGGAEPAADIDSHDQTDPLFGSSSDSPFGSSGDPAGPTGNEGAADQIDWSDLAAAPPPAPVAEENFSGTAELEAAQDAPEPAFDFADFGSATTPEEPEVAPAPGDDLHFELTDLPAPAPEASTGEGPGAPAAAEASAASADELEFDPTSGPASDDVDIDLNEPAADLESSSDKLEVLSFGEAGAAGSTPEPLAAASQRFHVRRKTGKMFGPFGEDVIIKMLEDGKLSGNEDISEDKETWTPIGSLPAFHESIEKLVATPPAATPTASASAEASATMQKLQHLYDGRMATVTVVHGRSRFEFLEGRIPLIAGGIALVLVIGSGVGLGFTRYGVFGIKKLFPAHISDKSPQFALLQDARKALLADTFKSYKDAVDLSSSLLKVREYPEARALWCQAIFYLQRRYGAVKPADLARAAAAIEEINSLGAKNVEVVKATAGAAITANRLPQALGPLQEAAARDQNADDIELTFLIAETYALQNQRKPAAEALNRILVRHKGSSKALHALGNLHQASGDAEKAANAYAAALEADANHLASAVELAAVELLLRKNLEKGSQALQRALDPKAQASLGPAELARTRALQGVVLARQFKPKEAIARLEEAVKLDAKSTLAQEQLGSLFLAQHEYAQALPLFKELAERDPQNLEAAAGYLSSLIGAGRMGDALTAVTQANARFPGNARIAYLYGRVNDSLDKSVDAEKHYKRAINADPKLLEASLQLAHLYLRFRRVPEAKAQLEQAAQLAPNDARVHAGLGDLAFFEGDFPRSRSEFDRSVELDPNSAEAHLGLSRVLFEGGSMQEAKAESEKALDLDPRVKEGRLQHGLVLWKLGKMEESIAELQKAKAEDPKSSRVAITTGAVMLEKGDLAEAEAQILSALTSDPVNAEAHFYLGKVKARRGEYNQAIDSMKNALERDPNKAPYHYELALILRDAKKVSEAIVEWKRAVELDPSYAESLEALGQAYLDRAEFDRAITSFEAALKADPKRTRILGLIGDCYFQAAKWDQAIAKYQVALQRDDSLTSVYFRLGRSFTEKGQHGQAISWYRKAIEAEPKNALPYYHLGYAYKEKRQKKEAIEAFKGYLALKEKAADRKDIEDEIYDLEHE